MSEHAEFRNPSLDDYYRIIDPLGKLSEAERSRHENKVLDEMPGSFPQALRYVMKLARTTEEKLSETSGLSVSTISRYKRDEVQEYPVDTIIAMCIGMHLPPWLSRELIDRADLRLSRTPRHRAFRRVLDCMYTASLDEVQEHLKLYGNAQLSLRA